MDRRLAAVSQYPVIEAGYSFNYLSPDVSNHSSQLVDQYWSLAHFMVTIKCATDLFL